MKTKLILIGIIVVLIVGVFGFKLYKNNYETKRYGQIKSDVYEETSKYLKIVSPNCHEGVSTRIDQDDLIVNGGMEKSKLLDIDKKNYCKTTVNADCINKQWKIKVYISCDNYEDKGYVEW